MEPIPVSRLQFRGDAAPAASAEWSNGRVHVDDGIRPRSQEDGLVDAPSIHAPLPDVAREVLVAERPRPFGMAPAAARASLVPILREVGLRRRWLVISPRESSAVRAARANFPLRLRGQLAARPPAERQRSLPAHVHHGLVVSAEPGVFPTSRQGSACVAREPTVLGIGHRMDAHRECRYDHHASWIRRFSLGNVRVSNGVLPRRDPCDRRQAFSQRSDAGARL